ncbi:hypothetical protein CTI12_AA429910 [Artemisia annua]|uniref:Helitron helicase-like domain-containing protein n=1 Tax=Artemisia annua TaxID=35608 RepID=A0A2U1M0Y5_ARTAN|nr:hypothetical protein CTI12_AA429910 [Artemisia annua]
MVSDLGSLDAFLNSVSERPCKARLATSHFCTGSNYREEAMTEGAREDGTFNVDYQCGYTSAMFLDQPSQSIPRVADGELSRPNARNSQFYTTDVCTSPAVQTTDGCNVQGGQGRSLSNLDGSRTSMDKGKRKMSELFDEDRFRSVRSHLAPLSETSETELLYIFVINGNESRVVPKHLTNTSTACGVGLSSHESSQNCATLTDHCNVELPRSNRQRRSQGPPDTYLHMGRCDQACCHYNARFWYDERVISGHRSRVDYHKCCNARKVKLHGQNEYPQYIKDLFTNRHFMENIRAYNQMFAMTSLGAEIDNSINMGGGPYVFKISGQLYHRIARAYSSGFEVKLVVVQLRVRRPRTRTRWNTWVLSLFLTRSLTKKRLSVDMAERPPESSEWPTRVDIPEQDDRESSPDPAETDEHDNAPISDAMAKQIRGMISPEIAKAQEAAIPYYTKRLSKIIAQTITTELDQKLAARVAPPKEMVITPDFYEHIKAAQLEAWENGDVNSERLVGQLVLIQAVLR